MNMKKIIPTILLLSSLPALTGCEESLDTYSGENGIYFDTKYDGGEMLSDTIDIHWGLKNSNITSQKIILTVKLFGNTAPVDRKFNIIVGADEGDDKAAQEGVDYVNPPLECVIPAGKAETPIEIELLRRHNLKDNPRRVKISLVESDELKFLFSRAIGVTDKDGKVTTRPLDYQRVLYMDETFPMPIWWDLRGQPYFGDWSTTKAALICDVMNIDREAWVAPGDLSAGYLKFCGSFMHRWLQDNPQVDENGEPMVMGPMSIN